MAVKGGQIIHVGNGVTVIDRVQTGGPGQVNIATEKIYELGNYKSVATVRETPDLSFTLESFDVSTEIEALLTGNSGETREVADAAITVGDKTLTSATAAFVAGDLGRTVLVSGAGADGGLLVTSITEVTSGTEVEVSDAAETTVAAGALRVGGVYDLAKARPQDFASQFKAGLTAADPFRVVSSIALPFLNLESMSYRFGVTDNATQTATLRGDSIFYSPGATFVENHAGTNTDDQTIVTVNPAYEVAEGDARRILSVTAAGKRLNFGADYTEAYGAVTDGAAVVTITLSDRVPATESIRIVYASPAPTIYPQSVHPDATVKPAAVKGRDIDVYIGGYDPADVPGSQIYKATSVQGVNVDWRVTLDEDNEFGNYYAVALDFDVPEVSGSVEFRPRDAAELQSLIRRVSNVDDVNAVVGTATSTPLALDIVIKNPEDGATLKRLHVPDARFTPPSIQGRVQQKLNVTLDYSSDEGTLLIFDA